jgi:hypothetical protein
MVQRSLRGDVGMVIGVSIAFEQGQKAVEDITG